LESVEDKDSVYAGKVRDDNLLHQLQNLFAALDLTERTYTSALDFCFSLKDHAK